MGWWQTAVLAFAALSVAGSVDRLRQTIEKDQRRDNTHDRRMWP